MRRESFSTLDYEKSNAENKKFHSLFVANMRRVRKKERYSDGTIRQYNYGIRHFISWNTVYNKNKIFYKMNKEDYLRYQRFLIDKGYSGNTINQKRVIVSKFYEYFLREFRHISPFTEDITKGTKLSSLNNSRRFGILVKDEIDRLEDYYSKVDNKRDYIILMLMFRYGLKFREVTQLKRSDIKHEKNEYGKYMLSRVRVKGREYKNYVIDEELMEWLRDYDDFRGKDNCESMFVSYLNEGAKELRGANSRQILTRFSDILGRAVRIGDIYNSYMFYSNIGRIRSIQRNKKRKRKK